MRYNVKVIGVGGIGGCVVPILAKWLNFGYSGSNLTLIDGDKFEAHNRERQLVIAYANKAKTVADQLRAEYDRLRIRAEQVFITPKNAGELIADGDVVFSCVDNHASRKVISDRCEQLDTVLLISGGNEMTTGNVQIHHRVDGVNLTLPIVNKFHPELASPTDSLPEPARRGCAERQRSEPQLLVMNNAVASRMLEVFGNYTVGAELWDEVFIDIRLMRTRWRRYRQEG